MGKVCRLPVDDADVVDQFTDDDVPSSGFSAILYWTTAIGLFTKHERDTNTTDQR